MLLCGPRSESEAVCYRRPLLAFVLGAIAVTAILGLWAVLVPHFGELQAKVLGTSAAVSGASVLVLAFTPARERRLLGALPAVGIVLTGVGFCLVVTAIWTRAGGETLGKTIGTTVILTVWAVLVCLLVLATLPARFRWTFLAAAGLTLALATVGIAAMWTEPGSTAVGRLAGVLAVLSAAFVLVVPILHRASRGELERADSRDRAVTFCPSCGSRLAGDSRACPRCGARFRVAFEE